MNTTIISYPPWSKVLELFENKGNIKIDTANKDKFIYLLNIIKTSKLIYKI